MYTISMMPDQIDMVFEEKYQISPEKDRVLHVAFGLVFYLKLKFLTARFILTITSKDFFLSLQNRCPRTIPKENFHEQIVHLFIC